MRDRTPIYKNTPVAFFSLAFSIVIASACAPQPVRSEDAGKTALSVSRSGYDSQEHPLIRMWGFTGFVVDGEVTSNYRPWVSGRSSRSLQLEFESGGLFRASTHMNTISGKYGVGESGQGLTISQLATTKVMEDPLGKEFVRCLRRSESYIVRSDTLILNGDDCSMMLKELSKK